MSQSSPKLLAITRKGKGDGGDGGEGGEMEEMGEMREMEEINSFLLVTQNELPVTLLTRYSLLVTREVGESGARIPTFSLPLLRTNHPLPVTLLTQCPMPHAHCPMPIAHCPVPIKK